MNNKICPIIEECLFFSKSSFSYSIVTETYQKKFCLNTRNFMDCKRYLVYLESGRQAPEYIVPNSQLSLDEISWKIE
jgi:hypothetical protein